MGADMTLSAALARVAYTYVKDAKVSSRRGSVAAFAVEMSRRGVKTSKSTLTRKLDGTYPLDTDDISVIADIVGTTPNALWQQAIALLNEAPAETISDYLLSRTTPEPVGGALYGVGSTTDSVARGLRACHASIASTVSPPPHCGW
jgi:hypothetical protein